LHCRDLELSGLARFLSGRGFFIHKTICSKIWSFYMVRILSGMFLFSALCFAGCEEKGGLIVPTQEQANQYSTPPEAAEAMKKAQEAAASKRP
jgi:hypothetical protein